MVFFKVRCTLSPSFGGDHRVISQNMAKLPIQRRKFLFAGFLLAFPLSVFGTPLTSLDYEDGNGRKAAVESSAPNLIHDPNGVEQHIRSSEAQKFLDLFRDNEEHRPRKNFVAKSKLFSAADQAILKTLNQGIIDTHQIYKEIVAEGSTGSFQAFKLLKSQISQENIKFQYEDLNSEFEVKELLPETRDAPAVLVFRVFHKPSGRTTLFVDKNAKLNHPRFRQYISTLAMTHSTHVHSASNGKFLESLDPSGLSENWNKPSEFFRNLSRLKHAYKLRKGAYVEFPPGTVSLAIMSSTAQGALVIGSGILEAYSGISGPAGNVKPEVFMMTGLSIGLGFSLGVLHRIQQNWQQKATDSAARKAFKKSVVGIPCKYAFYGLLYTVGTEGAGWSGLKMFFSPEAFSIGVPGSGTAEGLHLYVLSNMMLSAFARNAFTDLPLQQKSLGKGKGIVSIKIGGKEFAGFTTNDLYFSAIYLLPFTLSKADLLFHEKISIFGDSFEMGIGRVLLISGALLAGEGMYLLQKLQIKRAKAKHEVSGKLKDLAYLRKVQENHTNYLNSQKKVFDKFILRPLKFTFYSAPKSIYKGGNTCRLIFQNKVFPGLVEGSRLL